MRHAWGHKLQRFRLELPFCLFSILWHDCTLHAQLSDLASRHDATGPVHERSREGCASEGILVHPFQIVLLCTFRGIKHF